MSNPYCTIDQLLAYIDSRVGTQQSGDNNLSTGNQVNMQILLDGQASELESYLTGRYGLPLPSIPGILTKWVAVTTAERLYGRRTERPKAIDADAEWAKGWLEQLTKGVVGLPGIDRAESPKLQFSDSLTGRSRWDHIFGQCPSPTSQSGKA